MVMKSKVSGSLLAKPAVCKRVFGVVKGRDNASYSRQRKDMMKFFVCQHLLVKWYILLHKKRKVIFFDKRDDKNG